MNKTFRTKIITENNETDLESAIQLFLNSIHVQELYSCSYTTIKSDTKSKLLFSALLIYKIHD